MTEPSDPSRTRRLLWTAVVLIAGLALDLGSKAWAWQAVRIEGRKRIIDGLFHFEFAFNTGSAFGMLNDQSWARTFFIVITLAALLYLGWLALKLPTRVRLPFTAIGLIASGALGNLHDRLFRTMLVFGQGERHGVVDFIVVFYWPKKRWPAFNLADVFLLVGVGLFLIWLRRADAREDAEDDDGDEDGHQTGVDLAPVTDEPST